MTRIIALLVGEAERTVIDCVLAFSGVKSTCSCLNICP